MDDFSRKVDEMLEKFMLITSTVGSQIQGMNSSIAKMQETMKEEGENKFNQFDDRIMDMERKILDMDEKYEPRSEDNKKEHVDENQGKTVITGFHSGNNRVWSHTTLERNDKWNRNGLRKSKNRMSRKNDHSCFHSLHGQWRQKQVHQVSEHFEKRTERKKSKNNEINGCWRKIPQQKNGICQILHSYETQHSSQLDLLEMDRETRVSQRTDCGKNMLKWISQVQQIPRYWGWSWRTDAKMTDKKLIATTVSSREKGIRRREEEENTSSPKDDFTTGKPRRKQEESHESWRRFFNTDEKQQK